MAAQQTITAQTSPIDLTSPTVPTDLPAGQAGIKVTAAAQITVEIAVDGRVVYSGVLEAGQSTGWASGAEFSVFTSSGVNTLFQNHLGVDFRMGEEPGPKVYDLSGG